ncbi:aldehyde dehydrogenase family protein [Rhizobium sp. FKL33]|uniref:aldehyde dehydrogenase family protein n=1 Tax=Rhizobium sp. FKL33 TaxID=2562307 RepID=UPI001FEF864E|nr:aldehyde dehydrogenase family protein [Rhizobium sp. FKL33]
MLDLIKPITDDGVSATRRMFIDGAWRAAQGGAVFASENPTTGAIVANVPDASAADVEDAIAAAARAQPAWAALPPAARAGLFHRAAALFSARQQEFADMLVAETGSGFGKAMFECSLIPLALAEAAGLTTREIGEIYPSQVPGKINRTMRAPAGVIGVVSPWNFPLYLSMRGFIYAVALGNTAVLKPSEDSPIAGGVMLAELFEEAGFPPGVFNVVTTSRDGAAMVGDQFVNDKRIAVISFTGSTRVGQALSTACANVFKPIVLELGGKNPMIVLEDADLDRAVDLAFFGSFLHQGQICMSCDKVLVHRSIIDEFVKRLVAKTINFVPTNPDEQTCVIGPIINSRQLRRIETMVEEAVREGAKAHCGGAAQGPYYTATVLTNVNSSMRVWNEEIFGPVTTVTPFDTEDEAVALANDTHYGLSASVITSNVLRGELLAERIKAGMVHVNDSTVHDEPHCPFSGLGASGGGGKWGPKGAIEAFTVQRWISTQRQAHPLPF